MVHPERPKNGQMPVVDRGSIQGNLTGERREIFVNGNLSGLNLIPNDPIIKNGLAQTDLLAAQGVTSLGPYRGAYDYMDKGWHPGSDWMPYGLDVPKTMAMSEKFAKEYYSISIVPEVSVDHLPKGHLNVK